VVWAVRGIGRIGADPVTVFIEECNLSAGGNFRFNIIRYSFKINTNFKKVIYGYHDLKEGVIREGSGCIELRPSQEKFGFFNEDWKVSSDFPDNEGRRLFGLIYILAITT
jgi:hypothetical protein